MAASGSHRYVTREKHLLDSVNALQMAEMIGFVSLLMLLHALLATSEIALFTLRKTRLKQLLEEGNRYAILVDRLLSDPARLMATIQMSVTLLAMLAASTATVTLLPPLSAWLKSHYPNAAAYVTLLGLTLVMVPIAGFSLVIGGIIPKALATHNTERWALIAARPLLLLQGCLSPLVAIMSVASHILLRPFGNRAHIFSPTVNEQEIKMMVEVSEEQGVLEAEETDMITSVLDFSDTVARKVMTPRIDVTCINRDSTLAEVLAKIAESGHTRIPVYEGDIDNIVGVVHAKDLIGFAFQAMPEDRVLNTVIRAPYFIPESKKIDELLTDFRRTHQHIAIVRDEYGLIAGLITLEDLIEEIVGDIQDEYDQEEPLVQVIDARNTLFDGKISLEVVNERMGTNLPLDESDTLAGFVFGLLGHQAEVGERIHFEEFDFVVENSDGRRITKVRMCRTSEWTHAEEDAFAQQNHTHEDA